MIRPRIPFLFVLVLCVVVPSIYAYMNWGVVEQLPTLWFSNLFPIWIASLLFVIIFAVLFRFLSNQSYSLFITIIALSIFAIITFLTFYFNTQWIFFLPNAPIPVALEAGNLLGGVAGFVMIFVTGFALSLTITRSASSSLFLSLGLGAGSQVLETMFLAFLKLLYPIYVVTVSLAVMIVLLLLSRKRIYALRQTNLSSSVSGLREWPTITLLGIGAVFFAFILFQAIGFPSTEWDSLAYGLPYAKIIYESHSIPLIAGPSIGIQISANYPPGMQLLAAYLYNLGGGPFDIYYRLLEPSLALAMLLVVYRLGYVLFEIRQYATLTIFAVLSFPIWYFAIGTSYVMFTAAEFAIVLLGALTWYKTKDNKYLILSGLGCGFAALTSYVGFLTFLFPLLLVLVENRSRVVLKQWLVVISSGIFSVTWLIRNFVELGNPVYPLGGKGLNLIPLLYKSTNLEIINNADSSLQSPYIFLFTYLNESRGIEGPVLLVILIGLLLLYITKKGSFPRNNQNNFLITLAIVFSMTCFVIVVALNGFFVRYFVFFVPAFALGFTLMYREFNGSYARIAKKILLLFLVLGVTMSGMMLEVYGAIPNRAVSSEFAYLSQIYGPDVASWNWINTHTPANAVIATYEIRTYYINRTVIPLDGYQMAGLYDGNLSAEQVLGILRNQNISYILSIDWASPISGKTPEAYYKSALTPYLGNPEYFPTVFANAASAVYQVGNFSSTDIRNFPSNSEIYLSRNQTIWTTIINRTSPPSSMIYLPIQPDFQWRQLTASASSTANISLQLYNVWIPSSMTAGWSNSFREVVVSSPSQGLVTVNPLIYTTAYSGFYTLVIVDWSKYSSPVNVTVQISISSA